MRTLRGKYTILINRTPEDVFNFTVANLFENRPKWAPEIIELQKTSEGPVGVGTTWREKIRDRRGVEGEIEYTVTEYEPGEMAAMRGTAVLPEANSSTPGGNGNLTYAMRYLLRPALGGTRITLAYEYKLPNTRYSRIALFFWSQSIKRESLIRASRLRDLLEAEH